MVERWTYECLLRTMHCDNRVEVSAGRDLAVEGNSRAYETISLKKNWWDSNRQHS